MAFLRSRFLKVGLAAAALALAAGLSAGLATLDPEKKHPAAPPTPPASPGATRVTKPAPPKLTPSMKPAAPRAAEPAAVHGEPKADAKPEHEQEPKPQAADEHESEHKAASPPPPAVTTPSKRASEADEDSPRTIEGVLTALREGNARWVKGKPTHPHVDIERRAETGEQGQKPFAAILTCADSRLPVERLFDRGLGDLFVVRVAGNTAGTNEGGSLEYSVEHFKTPVLVVMGHTKCGAVTAATGSGPIDGPVGALVDQIRPAVERARLGNANAKQDDLVAAAVRENVWQSVSMLLKGSKFLREKAKSGELRIVGAVYNVAEGTVDFMGPHPWQSELIVAFDARANRASPGHAEANSEPQH